MQIRTSQTLPKKYNIFTRIDQLATYGTTSTILRQVFFMALVNETHPFTQIDKSSNLVVIVIFIKSVGWWMRYFGYNLPISVF
jgi:pyruvate carboxylase